MTPDRFRAIVEELTEENPLAVRTFLRLVGIRFTTEVTTLAVSCEDRPELRVNLSFIAEHCATDAQVKALILHEFLHIVLRHTEERGPITDAEHLATDAVINAIIHRQVGKEASSMMSNYYRNAEGLMRLLRPGRSDEPVLGDFGSAWVGLYDGSLVVDDIRELATQFDASGGDNESAVIRDQLLGNHNDASEMSEAMGRALDDTMRSMNGHGIWRSPGDRGVGGYLATMKSAAADAKNVDAWRRRTLDVLKRYVIADPRSLLRESVSVDARLPVLSAGDRRAFVRSLWSPFIPEAVWSTDAKRRGGTAQVYLDVSGSMWAEMPHLIALLGGLRRYIRLPFWAFSTEVLPATIRKGQLETGSTGGTSMECVLKHIARTRPKSAVIVTDGYIEKVQREWLRDTAKTRIHVVVSRDGSTHLLESAGLRCTQLGALPK